VQAEPLLEWSEVARELVSFVSVFLTAGALGFRYVVARRRLGDADPGVAGTFASATHRAAAIGLVGAIGRGVLLAMQLPGQAARAHVGVAQFVMGIPANAIQVALMAAIVLGFALAAARVGAGWALAALGVVGTPLRSLLTGDVARIVNPMHMLAGGLWIGTLFVLVAAGVPAVLRGERTRERRDALVADMVNAFSPLALVAAGTLALFGVITAWRHLPTIAALWTTPYGWALLTKLTLVAVVLALGAWNWRRMRPQLGTESATAAVRRSSTAELAVAGVVLVVTAILVSLPAPRRAGAPGGPGAPPAGAPPAGAPPTGAH
jgi:putative copper export protein